MLNNEPCPLLVIDETKTRSPIRRLGLENAVGATLPGGDGN